MRKLFLGAAIAACSAVGLHASDVAAQEAPGSVDVERIETTQVGQQQVYPVKFLCGSIGDAVEDPLLALGTYLTAINITNLAGSNVNLRVRAIESALAAEGTAGAATNLYSALQVRSGRAVEIDCLEIFEALEPEGQFAKGFVVIRAPQAAAIEVVAVYSYGGGTIDLGGGAGGGTPQ